MTNHNPVKRFITGILSLAFALIPVFSADTIQIKGFIKGRSGSTMIIQTVPDSATVPVTLTDETKVDQVVGAFKARRKEMSMAALIPGLAVEIEAIPGEHNEMTAKSVKFKGDDLKRARAIQAGMHETSSQAQRNAAEIKQNQEDIDQQRAALQKQSEALKQQQAQVNAQQKQIHAEQQKTAENRAAIDAAIARFGQLDDYYIRDQVVVYFANGKVDVDPKYNAPLLELARKSKSIQGYMIEVKGYASAVGSESLNQQLSEDRADNVANILIQKGQIPLTNMLSPAAMGESDQVGGGDNSAENQAQNRRVVVRVLQNKGIAGLSTGGGF